MPDEENCLQIVDGAAQHGREMKCSKDNDKSCPDNEYDCQSWCEYYATCFNQTDEWQKHCFNMLNGLLDPGQFQFNITMTTEEEVSQLMIFQGKVCPMIRCRIVFHINITGLQSNSVNGDIKYGLYKLILLI